MKNEKPRLETLIITKKEYDELKRKANLYNKLVAAGVDNWEGYSKAINNENNK